MDRFQQKLDNIGLFPAVNTGTPDALTHKSTPEIIRCPKLRLHRQNPLILKWLFYNNQGVEKKNHTWILSNESILQIFARIWMLQMLESAL